MTERTRGAICLGPTANFQGSYKFLCIRTGRRITRKKCKEVPMPTSVIRAVEALAAQDKQVGAMVFTGRMGNNIADINDNDAAQTPDDITWVTRHQDTANSNGVDTEDMEDIFHDAQGGDDEPPGIMMDYPGETPGLLNQTELQEHSGVQEPVGEEPVGVQDPVGVHEPEGVHESIRVHTPTPENENESTGVEDSAMEVSTPGDIPTTIPTNAPMNNDDDSDEESDGGIETEHTEIAVGSYIYIY
jgi:hypothetical protein